MNKMKVRTRAVFMAPTLVFFVGIVVLPVFASFYYSFFDWNGVSEKAFIGFRNFQEVWQDELVKNALINTLKMTFFSTLIQLPVAMVIALMITNRRIRGRKILQNIFFLPVILSSAIVGILWKQIYEPNYGLLNIFLGKIGKSDWQHAWLGEPGVALGAIIVVMLWYYVGNYVLIYFGALETVPMDVMEYARIDGVPPVKLFFSIQLPLIWPTIQLTTMLVIVNSLRYFDLVYIMTKGGPNHSTDVLATVIIQKAFDSMRFGYASAISMFLFFIGCIFILIINKIMKRETVYQEDYQ